MVLWIFDLINYFYCLIKTFEIFSQKKIYSNKLKYSYLKNKIIKKYIEKLN